MNDFVVYPKRGKMIMLSFLSFFFVLIGAVFISMYFVEEDVPFWLVLIGVVAILFFGLCMIYYIKELLVRKPSLIVSDDGIIDRSSFIGAGLVKWEDIADIDFVSMGGQPFLGIFTHDPELIINRTSGIKSRLNNLNKGLAEAQVNIPIKILACTTEKLVDEINIRWQKSTEETELQ